MPCTEVLVVKPTDLGAEHAGEVTEVKEAARRANRSVVTAQCTYRRAPRWKRGTCGERRFVQQLFRTETEVGAQELCRAEHP